MKKLATLCLSVVLGLGTVFAGSPARRMASPGAASLPKGKPVVVAPNAVGKARTSGNPTIGFNAGANTVARLPKSVKNTLAPSRIGPAGATVYGYLDYDSSETMTTGLSEVFLNGTVTNIMPALTGPIGLALSVNYMYVRDGKFYITGMETFWGMILSVGTYVYDPEGNQVGTLEYGDEDPVFNYAAYDPVKDMVYGLIETEDGLQYGTATGAEPNKVTVVATLPEKSNVCALTYNQVSGKLIGIQGNQLGKGVLDINTTTGDVTRIGEVEQSSDYITSLAYSPLDGGYYYAICGEEECGIALLDENTFAQLSYTKYDSLVEFLSFACPDDRKIEDGAPGESTLVNTIFGNGALSGSLTYRLATLTYGGTPVIGDIDWILEIDGTEAQRGKGAAGSDVTVNVADLTEGLHTFTFKASLGGNFGRYLITTFYVGNDTPVAPASVTLDAEKVTWTPVTKGVHEGYVKADEVTYNVYLNDKVIAQGIKATECASQLPAGELVENYVASVEAVFDGKVSEKTNSNDLKYGDPYTLPVSFTPTEKESRAFTAYDANGDGNTVQFAYVNLGEAHQNVPVFLYNYSSSQDADDWLFLPAASFTDVNAVYEFRMNCFRSDKYQESFEAKLFTAPNPDAAISTLIEPTELTTTKGDYDEMFASYFSAYFNVPSAGTYYVGIHVTSPKDQYRVFMRDFSLKAVDGMAVTNPKAVSALSAVAGAKGALNAAVTFTLPTATFNGVPYAADKDLTASVQAAGCDAVTATGKPGETVTVTVPTKQGDNTITVIVKDGDMESLPASVSLYTGVERPGTVENLTNTIDSSDYVMHITWEAPVEGVDGGYVAPTGVTYYLCEQGVDGWEATALIGTDVYSYDYTIPEGSDQEFVSVGILAENFVGMADYLMITSNVMGKPYDAPAVCSFTAGQILLPIVNYGSGYQLLVGNPGKDFPDFATPDNASAAYTKLKAGTTQTEAYITLPKVSTKSLKTPALKLDVYGGSADFSIVASAFGVEETVVKSYTAADFATKGRQTLQLDLPAAFNGKNWIELGIRTDISETASFILYGFKIYDNVPFDFGVTEIEGPTQAPIGEEATFIAHVTNLGSQANMIPASSWTLTDAEGNVVANVSVPAGTEAIQPDAETTFKIAFTPTAEQIGDMTLEYTIEKADNKEINDSMTKNFTVAKGVIPVVTDLTAQEIKFDEVTLAWTPLVVSNQVVDSFEDVTPFELDDATDMIGQFKRVDGDGSIVYGSQAQKFAEIPGAYGPSSFLCWSQKQVDEILGSAGTFEAKTGDQFLIAFCPAPETEGAAPVAADDWLISPEVTGGTDFSFSIRPITYQYGAEVIEVMYSAGSDKPEDFKVLESLEVTGDPQATSTTWHDYTFSLPADAKYFAIHYVSKDIFGIMIDDIAYAPAGSSAKLKGYDIYRDGAVIAPAAPCEDGTYTDSTVEENAVYTYMVMPVLSDGLLGLESNSLTIRTTGVDGIVAGSKAVYAKAGAIVVNGYEGEAVAVVSADGKVVASDAHASASKTFTVGSGVYVVKAGKDVVKLIVK